MLKKILVAAVVAGALIFTGASAASAEPYPADEFCTAAPNPIAPGQTSVITCTDIPEGWAVTFSYPGSDAVTEVAGADGTVTYNFVGPNVTSSTDFDIAIAVADDGGKGVETFQTTITVVPVAVPSPTTPPAAGGLPPTGGTVPAAAIWLGVGAIGIGGIAVAAAVARRRASSER